MSNTHIRDEKGFIIKSNAWYIKFPADAYALGPVRFEKPVGEREVRKYAREFEYGKNTEGKRLPHGFACWATDD